MPAFSEKEFKTIESDSPCADAGAASFAVRMLITIAERRQGVDASRCRLALLHLESATALRRSLHRALTLRKLTDLQFAVLVILFSTEPEPLSATVLAEHTAASQASITDALDQLESQCLATRTRDHLDRRVKYVRITEAGVETVDATINDYLHAAAEAVRHVRPEAQRPLIAAYLQLLRGAASSNRQERRGHGRAS